jgi:hypothetical protein
MKARLDQYDQRVKMLSAGPGQLRGGDNPSAEGRTTRWQSERYTGSASAWPALLFNGMIAPLMPDTIRGVHLCIRARATPNAPITLRQHDVHGFITDLAHPLGGWAISPFLLRPSSPRTARRSTSPPIASWARLPRTKQAKTLALPKLRGWPSPSMSAHTTT